MLAAVYAFRHVLPGGLSVGVRLPLLAALGAGVFGAGAWLMDRASVLRGLGFAAAALRRAHSAPEPAAHPTPAAASRI